MKYPRRLAPRLKDPGFEPTPAPKSTKRPWAVAGISLAEWRRLTASGEAPPPDLVSRGKPCWSYHCLAVWLRQRRAR